MAEKTIGAMAGPEAQVCHPVLTDAGAGQIFSMLGATMRLIATAAETGRAYTVLEQVTRMCCKC